MSRLICLYLEIEEKTTLFIFVYYSNWEWGPSRACVQAGPALFHVINKNTRTWDCGLRKTFASNQLLQTPQTSKFKHKTAFEKFEEKSRVNRRVKTVIRAIYKAPAKHCWILNFQNSWNCCVRNWKKSSNSVFLHSTTETADDNAKKWSNSSHRDRPGGSRPGPNHDNISLED